MKLDVGGAKRSFIIFSENKSEISRQQWSHGEEIARCESLNREESIGEELVEN